MPSRMFAQSLRIAALAAVGSLLSVTAYAQGTAGTGGTTTSMATGGIRAILLNIGNDTVNALGQIYLSKPACDANAPLKFRLDGAPPDRPSIDVYIGERCNGTDRKNSTTNSCVYLTSVSSGGVTQGLIITIHAKDLIKDCNAAEEAMPKLWFLSVNTPNGTEDVGNNFAEFVRLGIDTRPPGAPSGLSGGEGESVIPVHWRSGETHLKGFVVFIDTSGVAGSPMDAGTATKDAGAASDAAASDAAAGDAGPSDAAVLDAATADSGTRVALTDAGAGTASSAGACGPTLLTAGQSAQSVDSQVRLKQVNQPTATGVDLTPTDFGGATRATIAVAAVDLAGNQGPLSNLACVSLVPVTGFFDKYRANGGTAATGCQCRALGPAEAQSTWPVVLAIALIGLSVRRRRPS
jgi:hypothetical protein